LIATFYFLAFTIIIANFMIYFTPIGATDPMGESSST
jgi:hypothetical protein